MREIASNLVPVAVLLLVAVVGFRKRVFKNSIIRFRFASTLKTSAVAVFLSLHRDSGVFQVEDHVDVDVVVVAVVIIVVAVVAGIKEHA